MQTACLKPVLHPFRRSFGGFALSLHANLVNPEGDPSVSYVIVAPLDADDRIDPTLWRDYREACRIARLRPDQQDDHGHLVHRQGGGWTFHYDSGTNTPDDVGFHFADERFVPGEYVSINEGGKIHTYRVTSVGRL